ncbi:MAG TPA: UDP-N-acetylmuramate--L-alanine ligase [Candidatus Rhabdochlamydia sp.]|jgi:UDP-N-acetylmuramate--alanine ligase|nr:UDP-N-acetylmuramate--L-alanine ligase [Candidatus Rhabdochlamydia sp.]
MYNKHYYFIGIGGIGMSGLALIALEKGAMVSGSDVMHSCITNGLQEKGAKIFIGHKKEQIPLGAIVIYSSAISPDNPEFMFAKSHNLSILHRSDLLALFMQPQKALLVSGTHGKTTSSSLLAHVLLEKKMQPSFAIGGFICGSNHNAGYGEGRYFVAEADESDGSFLKYTPFGAIITNIDQDHLDYWQTMNGLVRGFQKFIDSIISWEHFFWHGDNLWLSEMVTKGYSYGFDKKNALFIESHCQDKWKNIFTICFENKHYTEIEIPIIGRHNILNASAVFGLCLKLGIIEEKIRSAFMSFKGINRRLEYKGEVKGIIFYDDYAHHPTEILTTLRAIKNAVGSRRVVLAFQPHRYSRTLACLNEFGAAFDAADVVVVTDIYAAGEAPVKEIDEGRLLHEINREARRPVHHFSRNQLSCQLLKVLKTGDCLITMGAGDISNISYDIMENL